MHCAVIQNPIGRLTAINVRARKAPLPRSRSEIVIVLDLELVLDSVFRRSNRSPLGFCRSYDLQSWSHSSRGSRTTTTTTTRTRRIGRLERNESF
jgi:hypothetical protein